MRAHASTICFSWILCLLCFLAGACPNAFAQTPGWVLQNFDGDICGWTSISPVTLTFDPTQYTGDGGGSCHVSDNLADAGYFDINASYTSCCDCDSRVLLFLSHYGSVDFDLKWDNTSTVTPAQFNTGPGEAAGGLIISGCLNNVMIPDAATNGWVHITAPVNPGSPYATNLSIGISLTSLFLAPDTGKLAFWIDNVALGVLTPHLLPAASSRGSNSFTLQWSASPGATCSLCKSTDLLNWTTLVTGYPPGGLTNGLGSYTDPAATNPRSFYRVSVP